MARLDEVKRSIEQMSIDEITPTVRSSVGDESAVVEPGWIAEEFSVGSIGTGTVGFLKVSGNVTTSGRSADWSLVIKIVDLGTDIKIKEDLEAFNSPGREVSAYKSGFFDQLTGQVKAAPCHGITQSGDNVMLWMEDLSDSVPNPWGKNEYLISSRGFGFFNGSWPEQSVTEETWFDREFVTNCPRFQLRRGWLDPLSDPGNRSNLDELSDRSRVTGLDKIPDGFSKIVESSLRLPRVLCHNDVHSRNAFFRYEPQGPITYAFDWASTGLSPVGLDGGALAGSGIFWSEAEVRLISEIESQMFAEYLSGLNDAGYKYRRDEVRLGYLSYFTFFITGYPVAAAVFPDSPMVKFWMGRFGVEGDEFFDQLALRLRMFKPLFDEAVSLARQLG